MQIADYKIPVIMLVLAAIPFMQSAQAKAPSSRPIPIKIGLKNSCWTYKGTFDGFVYDAKKGDELLISAAGEAHFGDGSNSWAKVEPRNIMVAGEAEEVVRPEGAEDIYRFEASGEYRVLLGPAAIEGMQSILIVCRAPPEESMK